MQDEREKDASSKRIRSVSSDPEIIEEEFKNQTPKSAFDQGLLDLIATKAKASPQSPTPQTKTVKPRKVDPKAAEPKAKESAKPKSKAKNSAESSIGDAFVEAATIFNKSKAPALSA